MASGNRNILVTVTRPGTGSYPQYPHCLELCVQQRESGDKYAGGPWHWTPRITAPANAGS